MEVIKQFMASNPWIYEIVDFIIYIITAVLISWFRTRKSKIAKIVRGELDWSDYEIDLGNGQTANLSDLSIIKKSKKKGGKH